MPGFDPLLLVWIIGGALLVLVLALLVWVLVAASAMRRLVARVDERFAALTEALGRRRGAAQPLLEAAGERRRAADAAFDALDAATTPGEKAAAEAELQQVLRPLVQSAASSEAGTPAADARAALAGLDDDVQARRRDYNTAARELNAKARRFPTSLFRRWAEGRRELFEVDHAGAVAEPPRIRF